MNLVDKHSIFQHPHIVGQVGPFLPKALLCGYLSLLSSPLAGPFLLFFPFFLQCLHHYMLFLRALTNVSHGCLISWMFLHVFHTSRPVRSLSAFSNHASRGPFHSLQSKCWDSTFVYVQEKACVKSILPALSSSLPFFLPCLEHPLFVLQFIMNPMLKVCHIIIIFLRNIE